jgi:hypothetical protein
MRVKNNFAAQEGMCLERATVAKREMEYWLSEAAEWKRLRESSDPTIALPSSRTGVPTPAATEFEISR